MKDKVFVYLLFYIGVFLLGFFGIAPLIVLDSMGEKIPYIILVVVGYPVIIALLVLWEKGKLQDMYKKIKERHGDGTVEKTQGQGSVQDTQEEPLLKEEEQSKDEDIQEQVEEEVDVLEDKEEETTHRLNQDQEIEKTDETENATQQN